MLIDLHTHTYPLSDDSELSVEALVERARQVGLDGLCLTEHDRFRDPEEVRALSRRFNFLILPGCEVNVDEGHVLVYGVHRYIFGMHKGSFLRRVVDEAGGVMIVAHPYRRKFREEEAREPRRFYDAVARACRSELLPLVDAVEVLNGRGSPQENAFSQELARLFRRPGTGASDAHRLEDIGTFATEFFTRIETLDDLIRELKAGRFRPVVLRAPER